MSETPVPASSPAPLHRAYAVCALCIGTGATFFLTGVAPLPVLLYFPLSRRFGFEPSSTDLSMDYYGRSLLALLAGLALALSTYTYLQLTAHFKREPASPSPTALAPEQDPSGQKSSRLLLFTAYAATALFLAAGLFAYQLSGRVLSPEPLFPAPLQAPASPTPAPASADVASPS